MNQNNLWITHKQLILILVVVEDGLVRTSRRWKWFRNRVSILIVMEDGLVQELNLSIQIIKMDLNPYSRGRWSRTLAILSQAISQNKS